MTRLVLISDTHTLHLRIAEVPDGDILIHAGDLTSRGSLSDVEYFNEWLGTLPHPYKVVIAGNHDFCFQTDPNEACKRITNAHYLQDSAITLAGLRIYGSPWQPWFHDWAFNLHRGDPLKSVWAKIPADTNVLVTHGPPFGILDKLFTGNSVGCEELLRKIQELRQLKLNVFGHIHEAYGAVVKDGIHFVNASICDLQYQTRNRPIVVDL